jgi:hypothetical protein
MTGIRIDHYHGKFGIVAKQFFKFVFRGDALLFDHRSPSQKVQGSSIIDLVLGEANLE